MSVAQVKKRFGEMESYLGRDKEALRRLKLLKDDVNVLRTSLAAAEEKAAEAEAVKEAARKRADEAEINSQNLERENHQLAQKLASLTAALAAATKPEPPPADPDDPDRLIEIGGYADIKRTVKELKKVLPKCPRRVSSKTVLERAHTISQCYMRHEIADGWSHKSLWTVGAAVALIAAENGQVTIIDTVGVALNINEKGKDGFAFNFLTWFRENNDLIQKREAGKNMMNMSWRDKPGDADRTAEFFSRGE